MPGNSNLGLETWLEKCPPDDFPEGEPISYSQRFRALRDYMNAQVHPNVEKGALLHDDGYLTDHGPEHILTVIRRADDLLGIDENKPPVTGYEAFFLLCAIHFHDVGNIYGRAGHEKKLADVMEQLEPLVSEDSVERRIIRNIAEAHGGTTEDGDKDTIRRLEPVEFVRGRKVRLQLLAAILRFADELADDSNRAARFMIKLNQIPKQSQVHHAYAASLNSVLVERESSTVDLQFVLDASNVGERLGKGKRSSFLLDEVFSRTLKMHTERMYCSRFFGPATTVESIRVRIRVYEGRNHPTPKYIIRYLLRESGYPSVNKTLAEMCPDVGWTGSKLQAAMSKISRARRRGAKRA